MSTTRDYSGKDKAELANLRANAERILAAPGDAAPVPREGERSGVAGRAAW